MIGKILIYIIGHMIFFILNNWFLSIIKPEVILDKDKGNMMAIKILRRLNIFIPYIVGIIIVVLLILALLNNIKDYIFEIIKESWNNE